MYLALSVDLYKLLYSRFCTMTDPPLSSTYILVIPSNWTPHRRVAKCNNSRNLLECELPSIQGVITMLLRREVTLTMRIEIGTPWRPVVGKIEPCQCIT